MIIFPIYLKFSHFQILSNFVIKLPQVWLFMRVANIFQSATFIKKNYTKIEHEIFPHGNKKNATVSYLQ